ncbi:MAG: hypothetical protein NXH97_21895 [Rhodobacteraceae bacterium]|nr:hypothetical protein [Paracoccaceae bacterium]
MKPLFATRARTGAAGGLALPGKATDPATQAGLGDVPEVRISDNPRDVRRAADNVAAQFADGPVDG